MKALHALLIVLLISLNAWGKITPAKVSGSALLVYKDNSVSLIVEDEVAEQIFALGEEALSRGSLEATLLSDKRNKKGEGQRVLRYRSFVCTLSVARNLLFANSYNRRFACVHSLNE